MTSEAEQVASYADRVLDLSAAELTDDYDYQSLPLCVIDAVYSIGVRYEGVRNVVTRYCERTGQRRVRHDRNAVPPQSEQESISAFCVRFESAGVEAMTSDVFENRQRTSSRGGILKSDAVYRFAIALRNHGAEFLQDVPAAAENADLQQAIYSIPGQSSGISLQYFWMLAGSDEFIKPDRMVLRFLESALGRSVSLNDAQVLLRGAAEHLKSKYTQVTPRLLDYAVWLYQRAQPA